DNRFEAPLQRYAPRRRMLPGGVRPRRRTGPALRHLHRPRSRRRAAGQHHRAHVVLDRSDLEGSTDGHLAELRPAVALTWARALVEGCSGQTGSREATGALGRAVLGPGIEPGTRGFSIRATSASDARLARTSERRAQHCEKGVKASNTRV